MKPKKKTTKKTVKKTAKKNTFMGIDFAFDPKMERNEWSMLSPDFSTLSRRRSESSATLTPEDIQRAIDMIHRQSGHYESSIVESMLRRTGMRDVTDLLEIMLALIETYQINIKHGPAPFGEQVIISMSLPLGRNTQTMNAALQISRDDKEHARYDRHYSYREMFVRLLDPVRKWIEIAERAKTEMSFTDILKIENIEQRRAALRIFGEERLLDEARAELLDTGSHGQQLYVIPESVGAFDTAAFFLKYNCPSTGRLYISGVDPSLFIDTRRRWRPMPQPIPQSLMDREWKMKSHIGWADTAMAWKFHMTPEEYARMPRNNQA